MGKSEKKVPIKWKAPKLVRLTRGPEGDGALYIPDKQVAVEIQLASTCSVIET